MSIYWNPYVPWFAGGALAAGLVLWLFLRARRWRIVLRRQLALIACQLKLEHPAVKPYPVLTLHGKYYSYEIAIESKTKGDPHYPWLFRIHLELQQDLKGRLYIQSEAKPAKIARLYGMEVIITGNAVFDNQILVCSTNEPSIQLLFTPYLIERFLRIQLPPFSMDFYKHSAYAEVALHSREEIAAVSHLVALMVEIAEFLQQGRHTLEPFDPPPLVA